MKLHLSPHIEDVEDLIDDLEDARSEDARVKAVADFLAAGTPLDAILPPPIGSLADAAESTIYQTCYRWTRKIFKRPPAKRAARRAKRAARKAARK